MKRFAAALATWLLVGFAGHAQARVERFAIVVGNNLGAASEAPLRFAESDAARMFEVFTQLGDFDPINSVLLRGKDSATVRNALLAINGRIRDAISQPDTQAVLAVYYSGHADGQALHLAGTELPLSELRELARGSAANFRLVILDACRSGSLTRVKGGERLPAFSLNDFQPAPPPGDGLAFLTASSANEDAQESDELQGAFFTHAFISGLLGAADSDGDGAVVLDEAYRHAYDATLRSTSRTLAGTQHPTFQYDLRGRGELVLTRPRAHAAERAHLDFPPGLGFMLMRAAVAGPVVAELESADARRTLSLEPGRYFIRARGPDVMYEGLIEAASGTSRAVEVSDLTRIEYAQLVRRRGSGTERAHGLETGMSVRSALPNAQAACFGGFAGYAIDWSGFGVRARFNACSSGLRNALLTTDVMAYDVSGQVYRAWDLAWLSFDLGVGTGLSLFSQRFTTAGRAPTRVSGVPFVSFGAGAQANLPEGFYASLGLSAETHFMRVAGRVDDPPSLTAAFALRTSFAAGKRF
jgi:hypothetical protein